MAFLDFASDGAAAFGTAKEAEKRLLRRPFFRRRISPTAIKNGLHLVKQFLGYDRFVVSLIHLPGIVEMTVVNGIGKQIGNERPPNHFAGSRAYPVCREVFPQVVENHCSSRILFKRLFDKRCAFPVNHDSLGAVVVDIAERSDAGIFAASDFFAQTALGVFGQGIHVVFALPEHDIEHEFALRVGFKTESGEFERFDNAGIKEINDASTVNTVAGKAVGMPCEDSVRLPRLYTLQHGVKNRSAGDFGGLLLDQFCDDVYAFALGNPSVGVLVCRVSDEEVFWASMADRPRAARQPVGAKNRRSRGSDEWRKIPKVLANKG
ncbi:MAG: hypothetical protein WBN22_13925 [Verrucomicrobiia bacterium]